MARAFVIVCKNFHVTETVRHVSGRVVSDGWWMIDERKNERMKGFV